MPGPLEIRRTTPGDRAPWNAFADRFPDALYLQHQWLDLISDTLRHEAMGLIAESAGEVRGILPLVRIRSRLFGHMIVSVPFLNLGGVRADSEATERALLERAALEARESGADYLEVRGDRPLQGMVHVQRKVSMIIDLSPGESGIWEGFSSKHRTNVRRAARHGIEADTGGAEDLPLFYALMEVGWRALGTPVLPRAFFSEVADRFGDGIRITVARQGDTPVAAALNLVHGGTLEGMWLASDPAFRGLQPNYVLYWEMIRTACREGLDHYHLGRSTAGSGPARFKEKWNPDVRTLTWNYHLAGRDSPPELNPDNPRFALAIRSWRRIPLPVLRLVGPRLARLLP